MFQLMCVHIIFSSVWVAEWPPFGKELLTWLTILCSLCILTIAFFVISRSAFEDWIWILIASVPGLCIFFTLLTSLWSSRLGSIFQLPTYLILGNLGYSPI